MPDARLVVADPGRLAQLLQAVEAVAREALHARLVALEARARAVREPRAHPAIETGVEAPPHLERRVVLEQPLQRLPAHPRRRPGRGVARAHVAGVAEARLEARTELPVDDRHLVAVLGEVVRGGDADHAGAEDEDFHARCLRRSQPLAAARHGLALPMTIVGQPGHHVGEEGDDHDADDQHGEERHRDLGDEGRVCLPVMFWSTNRLNPTGGVICGDLDQQHDEDAEPDEIDAGLLDGREQHADRQHDHRDAVEEAAEDEEERPSAPSAARTGESAERSDPLGECARQARCSPSQRQERRAGEDERDHAVQRAWRRGGSCGRCLHVSERCTTRDGERADARRTPPPRSRSRCRCRSSRARAGSGCTHRDQVARGVELLREASSARSAPGSCPGCGSPRPSRSP